jgi:hypothetical protein
LPWMVLGLAALNLLLFFFFFWAFLMGVGV